MNNLNYGMKSKPKLVLDISLLLSAGYLVELKAASYCAGQDA